MNYYDANIPYVRFTSTTEDYSKRFKDVRIKVLFDENGNTLKEHCPNGSVKRYNSWVHIALKKAYQDQGSPCPEWLTKYSNLSGNKFPCPFGLPQLQAAPLTKPVAIVKSAKTAVIASAFFPQYAWLAIGSLSYLNETRLRSLKGRKITLFPDQGVYDKWNDRSKLLAHIGHINVSSGLENKPIFKG